MGITIGDSYGEDGATFEQVTEEQQAAAEEAAAEANKTDQTGNVETSDPNNPQSAAAVSPALAEGDSNKSMPGPGEQLVVSGGESKVVPIEEAQELLEDRDPSGKDGVETSDDGESESNIPFDPEEAEEKDGDVTGTLDTTEAGTTQNDADAVTPGEPDGKEGVNANEDGTQESNQPVDPADAPGTNYGGMTDTVDTTEAGTPPEDASAATPGGGGGEGVEQTADGSQEQTGGDSGAGETQSGDAPAAGGEYNPDDHKVSEVNAYLAKADDAERERVLAAERAGQARKGILEA